MSNRNNLVGHVEDDGEEEELYGPDMEEDEDSLDDQLSDDDDDDVVDDEEEMDDDDDEDDELMNDDNDNARRNGTGTGQGGVVGRGSSSGRTAPVPGQRQGGVGVGISGSNHHMMNYGHHTVGQVGVHAGQYGQHGQVQVHHSHPPPMGHQHHNVTYGHGHMQQQHHGHPHQQHPHHAAPPHHGHVQHHAFGGHGTQHIQMHNQQVQVPVQHSQVQVQVPVQHSVHHNHNHPSQVQVVHNHAAYGTAAAANDNAPPPQDQPQPPSQQPQAQGQPQAQVQQASQQAQKPPQAQGQTRAQQGQQASAAAAAAQDVNAQNSSSSTDASLDIDNEPPLDGYERTDRIGQGAYGIVYRGTQRSTGVTVAIKRIPFADAAPEGGVPCNVIREISLLRELDHPNVVRLLDVNQARPGELYLVFEFVAHDLKTFLDRSQPGYKEKGENGGSGSAVKSSSSSSDVNRRQGLAPHVVRSFLRQILEGVGYCHTYRILHRDLKPHNLLISSDGRQVKLADFGLARLSGLPSGPYTSEVVTLWYRAPELLLGATRYCGPVDVWSIGCIFAEMATGYALFPGRSDIDQLFKIFQRRGTPQDEPTLNRLPHYNAEFPKWNARDITDFVNLDAFGGKGGHAADLLEQLLQYDPERRLICKQALHHPFFFET